MPLAFRRSRARLGLLALASLCALLAAAALALQQARPANAQSPDAAQLVLSLVNDSDNIVPAGSELTVRAQLRYSGTAELGSWINLASGSNLRLSGSLDWDDNTVVGSRNDIDAQVIGGPLTELIPLDSSGDPFNIEVAASNTSRGTWPVAYDGRTLVARIGESTTVTDGALVVFDLNANPPKQVLHIPGVANEGLAGDQDSAGHPIETRPVAVWDQNATTAWLFAGAPRADTNVGKLYIWKITYSTDAAGAATATATQITTPLAPGATEVGNRELAAHVPYYGSSVAITPDGQTLAVGAINMNSIGAVYVYTMPDGDDEDWLDLEYGDGIKVTPVQVPAWGNSSNRPFTRTATGRTGAATDCDAHCSAVSASRESRFGGYIEFARDGTLVAGAIGKSYASDTPGGASAFTGGPANAGAVWVFNAPTGGWSNAPDGTAGKTAFSSTLLTTNATTWDPASHYAPAPGAKRVVEADAELLPEAWSERSTAWDLFGYPTNISTDGSTIVVTAAGGSGPARTYVFEKPADGWADSSTPTATLALSATGGTGEGTWGTDVNYDGSRVLVADDNTAATVDGNEVLVAGVVYVFEPNSGGWAAQDSDEDNEPDPDGVYEKADVAHTITAPTPRGNARFTAPLYNNAGTLIAWAETDYYAVPNINPKLYISADICTDRTLDALTTTTCTLDLGDTSVTVPAGTPDGTFTISGRVNATFSDGTVIANGARGSLEVTIGKVKEVDSATLSLATDPGDVTVTGDEKPYPELLRTNGDTTRLLLRILNENGAASHAGSVAAVLVTSNAGELGLLDSSLRGDDCGGISCQLNATKINAGNADRLVLTLAHKGKAATAEVRATVFSTAGDSFETPPVSIALAGPAESIAVASTTSGVLNVDAVSEDADGDEVDSGDTRDELTLAVTATDSAGNDVALPTGARRANVLDPDGKRVASTAIQVVWPHRANPNAPVAGATATTPNVPILNAAGKQQVRINVNSPASAPLKSGEYTLELWAGVKKAERKFNVSGGATEISLSGPSSVMVGETFTVTASFQDASGAAVPNGTMVDWPEIVTATGTGQLVVLTSKDTRTTDGSASASWLAVNSGSVVVTAGADCTSALNAAGASIATCAVSGVQLVSVQAIAAAASTNPADDLTERNPGSLSTWLGGGRTSAGELLANLPGVNGILLWLNGQWVRYGVADGQEIPGSTNFEVNPGAILWLAR